MSLHALLLEARALTRDGVAPMGLVNRLQQQLEHVDAPVSVTTVVTLGLIFAARGELGEARRLFESAAWLPGDDEFARGWLVADAAALGEWDRVRRFARPISLEGRFFLALASRTHVTAVDRLRLPSEAVVFLDRHVPFVGPPGTHPAAEWKPRLPDGWVHGFVAGGREPGAMPASPQAGTGTAGTGTAGTGTAGTGTAGTGTAGTGTAGTGTAGTGTAGTGTAGTGTAGIGAAGTGAEGAASGDLPAEGSFAAVISALLRLSPSTVSETARAASALLSAPWLRAHLFERATLLGAGDPDHALTALRELFREQLGDALDTTGGSSSDLLRDAASDRREALLQALDERLEALTRRCEADEEPPLPVVWSEFVALVFDTRLAMKLGDADARIVPHNLVVRRLRYLGAWLRVTRDEQAFAKAVFNQLEQLAREAGDEPSASLAATAATWCKA